MFKLPYTGPGDDGRCDGVARDPADVEVDRRREAELAARHADAERRAESPLVKFGRVWRDG